MKDGELTCLWNYNLPRVSNDFSIVRRSAHEDISYRFRFPLLSAPRWAGISDGT